MYQAYKQICYAYKIQLRRPTIEVCINSSKWGQWDPLSRSILISQSLIVGYSWDCVVNVLKHEMAHQYVCEVLGQSDQHGEIFKSVCKSLGLPKAFCGARCDLDVLEGAGRRTLTPEQQAVLERVKKLLSLAQSANEHEALLAMQKAQALNEKYNLNEVPEFEIDDYDYLIIRTKKKRLEAFRKFICSILTSHYFVEVLYSEEYDAKDDTEYRIIELMGTRQNIEMAEYVYHFLVNKLDQLWVLYRKTTTAKLGRSSKGAYFLGLVSGFRKKLDAMQAPRKNGQHAQGASITEERKLVVMHNDDMLDQFMRSRHPRIRNVRAKRRLSDQQSYSQGLADGRNIVLHKGIEHTQTGRVLAIE